MDMVWRWRQVRLLLIEQDTLLINYFITHQVRLLLIEQDAYKRRKPCTSDACARLVDYSLWDARLRAAGFVRIWYAHDTFAPKTAGWSKNLYHSAWARAAAHTGNLVPGAACTEHKKRYGLTNSQLNCVAEQSEQGTRPEAGPEAGPSAAGPSLRQMRELLDAQSFEAGVAPP